jgi:tetratricopeptide (TPR) repeat protein
MCEPTRLIYAGQPSAAVAALDETGLKGSDRNAFLYHVQRGHLLHMARDYEASNREFEAAVSVAKALEPWSVTETLSDYTLNDAVKAYAGEDYERAYLHYYMALNYLEMDDLESALVECRRLDEVFRELDARYEDDGRYQDDGFIRYLSGLIYESMGKRDDALIDYRLAASAYEEERGGDTGVPVPRGLMRSIEALEGGARRSADGEAEIVVVVDSGWAPFKVEKSVEVPIHRALVPEELRGRTNLAAYVKVAYPEYVSPPDAHGAFRAGVADSSCGGLDGPAGGAEPRFAGGSAGMPPGVRGAELVQDVDALARWTLERRKPAIVLRSTLRATAKQVALARAKHEREEERDSDSDKRPFAGYRGDRGGFWGWLLGWLFEDLATHAVAEIEQADTRSWLLLPSTIWMVRVPVEPGEYDVCVSAGDGSPPVSLGRVKVDPGGKAFRGARFFGGPHPVRCE